MGQIVLKDDDEKRMQGFKHAPKFDSNPFIESLVVSTRHKKVTVARGSGLVNMETGEIEGLTEIGQIIEVDDGEFIKVFTNGLAEWFDLSKTGIRVFGALMRVMQKNAIGKDIVYFDSSSEEMTEFKISKQTFYRGLEELIRKGFIARHKRPGLFFINPSMFFNGNRARFIKEYRLTPKKPSKANNTSIVDDRTLQLPFETTETTAKGD